MPWTPEQYNQLAQHYRDASDAELLRLAATPDDLTDIAFELLKKEVNARGIVPGQPTVPVLPENTEEIEENTFNDDDWFSYAQKAPPDCTFEFASVRLAQDAAEFLSESGIRSQVLEPNPNGMSLLGPRLAVLPKDSQRASRILSNPIPEHISNEPDIVPEDFVVPSCPNCDAPDPILTSSDPTNHWLCESCEHEWDDPTEPEPAA